MQGKHIFNVVTSDYNPHFTLFDEPPVDPDSSHVLLFVTDTFAGLTTSRSTMPPSQDLAVTFEGLATAWRMATFHQSNFAVATLHPLYRQIVNMGNQIAPLLYRLIQGGQLEWSQALSEITGFDPTSGRNGIVTNEELRRAWARWCADRHFDWFLGMALA